MVRQLLQLIDRIRNRWRPPAHQAPDTHTTTDADRRQTLTDREYAIRSQAADYAWALLVVTGLSGRNRSETDHEAWLLGERLRELYLESRRRGAGTR